MDTLLNRTPGGDAENLPTTPGHETPREGNRFDRECDAGAARPPRRHVEAAPD
jgi:hypothetical protein